MRAIRDQSSGVQVGDLVITVDGQEISQLKTGDEVQNLLRNGTSLIMRRRDAIIPQYVKPRPVSSTLLEPRSSSCQARSSARSQSMDRISEFSSYTNVTKTVFNLKYQLFTKKSLWKHLVLRDRGYAHSVVQTCEL